MDANHIKLLMAYNMKLQNQVKVITDALDRRIVYHRRKRHQKLIKLLQWRRKRFTIMKAMLQQEKSRSVWTEARTGTFWEKDLAENNDDFFRENLRLSRESFEMLCIHLEQVQKRDTNYRKSISLQKRTAIALYALGSSAEYRSIADLFGVSKSKVSEILKEFCEKVWNVLAPIYINAYPLTQELVAENVRGFEQLGFPQCFGAIDSCHIKIKPPAEDAADYYNYKGWYSTVLLAVVDYRYRFLYINVGSPGRCNDSQIFEHSSVRIEHENPILKDMSRTICGVDVPVVLIGDSAFRFSDILMKPYPFNTTRSAEENKFNFCLSKCRRVVEKAFGHLKARFRRIEKGLDNNIKNTNMVIKCCCVLHNFLNIHNDHINMEWLQSQSEPPSGEQQPFNKISVSSPTALNIRNAITRYLALDVDGISSSDGAVVGVISDDVEDSQFLGDGVDGSTPEIYI